VIVREGFGGWGLGTWPEEASQVWYGYWQLDASRAGRVGRGPVKPVRRRTARPREMGLANN